METLKTKTTLSGDDLHQLSKFLKIVRNYLNMKKALLRKED
mgnify:CR=1 FL=1